MKLFQIELKLKKRRRGRTGVEVIVHAKTKAAAERHLAARYTGCEIVRTTELENIPKHFVVADLEG